MVFSIVGAEGQNSEMVPMKVLDFIKSNNESYEIEYFSERLTNNSLQKDEKRGSPTRYFKFIKHLDMFKVEIRLNKSDEFPVGILTYDGATYYSFDRHIKLLKVGSDPDLFERMFTYAFHAFPLTCYSYLTLSDADIENISHKMMKLKDFNYSAVSKKYVDTKVQLNVKFKEYGEGLLQPELVELRLFDGEGFSELDHRNSTKFKIERYAILNKNKMQKSFFQIPAGEANAIIDYDIGNTRIELK